MMSSFLRACAGCSGSFLGHNSTSMQGAYICPNCSDMVITGDELMPGDKVHRIDGPPEDFVVVDRSGFTLMVRRLGSEYTFPINAWAVYRLEYRALSRRKERT